MEIRNAAQTAQLATLNHKISEQMTYIITTMLEWRYNVELNPEDVRFSLSSDFSPVPIGHEWIRLVSDLYTGGVLPKSILLETLKVNDIIPSDYNDTDSEAEILADPNVVTQEDRFARTVDQNLTPEE